MDFHTLPRRDLQFLCKKNKITANMTNAAMVDALKALQIVEGIDEILKEALKLESPKKAEAGSPELPRTTSRRASARRAPAAEEPKGTTQGSPLPRSRRVTAKALEIMQLVDGDGVEEEEKQEGKKEMPKTPAAALRSSRKPQGTAGRRAGKKGESGSEEIVGETPAAASGARTTRRRTSKKEQQEGVHEAALDVPLRTPATRGRRRTAAAAPAAEEDKKEEEAAGASRTTARRTRQTARKATESATAPTAGRRVTRAMAAAKMAELDQEEEEDENNDRVKEGINDPKSGSPLVSDEKSDSLKNMKVFDSKMSLVQKMDGCEGALSECNEEAVSEEVGEQKRDQGMGRSDPLSGLEDSPIRGIVSEVTPLSLCHEIAEKCQEASIADLVPVDSSHQTEERNGSDGPDGNKEDGSDEAAAAEESRDGEVLNLPLHDSAESENKVLEDTEGLLEIMSISGEVLPKTAAESSITMDDGGSSADPTGSPAKKEGIPEELINSSAKSSSPVGDLTGEIIDSAVASLMNTSIDTGDLVENKSNSGLAVEAPEAQPLDSGDCSVETATKITSKTSIDTGDLVENKSNSGLAVEAPEAQPLDSGDCSVETTTKVTSKTSIDTGDLVENKSNSGLAVEAPEAQPLDSGDCSVETATKITSPVEGVEEKSARNGRVPVAIYEEETSTTETMGGAESREAEAQVKAEDQNLPKAVDMHSSSLRNLRKMYKVKLINMNNNTKVMEEGKRLALAELNENLLS